MISPSRRDSINMSALLHLTGLFVHPCTRLASASQAREPDSPSGLRPLPYPWDNESPPAISVADALRLR
jgi:hypothetical protein